MAALAVKAFAATRPRCGVPPVRVLYFRFAITEHNRVTSKPATRVRTIRNHTMLGITNRTSSSVALGVSALVSLSALTGCANKVKIEPQANFLQNGTYRSRFESAPGSMTGLYLQLNGNGRFSMSTLQGGCFVTED